MSTAQNAFRVRLACPVNGDPAALPVKNLVTGQAALNVPKHNDVQFELALADATGKTVITSKTGLTSITLNIYQGRTQGTVLVTKTIASGALADLTQNDWDSGDPTKYMALVTMSAAETNFDLGGEESAQLWLEVYYLEGTNRVDAFFGAITFFEPGVQGSVGSVVTGAVPYVLMSSASKVWKLTMTDAGQPVFDEYP